MSVCGGFWVKSFFLKQIRGLSFSCHFWILRWDIQRIREQRMFQRLQQRMNRKKVITEAEPELSSFYPDTEDGSSTRLHFWLIAFFLEIITSFSPSGSRNHSDHSLLACGCIWPSTAQTVTRVSSYNDCIIISAHLGHWCYGLWYFPAETLSCPGWTTEVDVASRCPKNTRLTGLVGSEALPIAAQNSGNVCCMIGEKVSRHYV